MHLYVIFIEIDGSLLVGWLVKVMHCGVVCIVGSNLLEGDNGWEDRTETVSTRVTDPQVSISHARTRTPSLLDKAVRQP